MNNYIEKYKKITTELIQKSFPILKNKLIFISENRDKKWYSGISYDFILFKHIGILKRSRKYSINALKGLLAHELSHLENSTKMSFHKKIIYFIKWYFFKKIKAEYETMTDFLLIEKGYGKEYFQFLKERQEKGYLNLEQIKEYMKKIK